MGNAPDKIKERVSFITKKQTGKMALHTPSKRSSLRAISDWHKRGSVQMGLFDRIKRAFTGEDVVQTPVTEENKIVIDKFDKGMEKTRKSFSEKMNELFAGFREVDEEFFDDLEETLISADVGFDMTLALSDVLRDEVKMKNVRTGEQVKNVIIEKWSKSMKKARRNCLPSK